MYLTTIVDTFYGYSKKGRTRLPFLMTIIMENEYNIAKNTDMDIFMKDSRPSALLVGDVPGY